jgi:quercetin dioxygenase-like cupin family protein
MHKEYPQIQHFLSDISYSKESIVSKKLLANSNGNVSLFSFDKGQELSEHTAPYDALVQILEGEAKIIIDGVAKQIVGGQSIIMPANIPHALVAMVPFKMLLTMIKGQ